MRGATLLLATDNEVVEAALYKGKSMSEKLFNLIVKLRIIELQQGAKSLLPM